MNEHKHHKDALHAQKPRKGYRVAFLLAFSAGLMAEMLLFMHAQMREIAVLLKEDFRIIVVRDEKSKETSEAMGAALAGIPGTAQAVYVSRQDRLARLKAEEPELVASVLSPGSNPMPDTWEVMIGEDSLGDMNAWTDKAWRIPGVADVKYKPLEAYAIMHSIFYGHLIALGLALAFLAFMVMAAMALTHGHTPSSLAASLGADRNWFFAGAGGGAASALAAYVVVYPVKYLSPVWVWPNPLWQAAVTASGALLGWALCQWKNDRY
ncbi:MAG: permease-like cell division protein FtsX [Elusimicrobiota bacterium]|nr:permease-like cell division protein FtsX [Elusimicrobiota bacterium]